LIKKKRENQSLSRILDIDEELKDNTLFLELPNQSIQEREEIVFNELFKNLEEICLYKESINYEGKEPISLRGLRCWKAEKLLHFTSNLNKLSIDENSNNPEVLFTNNLEKDVLKLLDEFQIDKSMPCVFVIDEAKGLLYKSLETPQIPFSWCLRDIDLREKEPSDCYLYHQSPYNVFQRVFRVFSGIWERLILINVSSCLEIIIQTKSVKIDLSYANVLSPKILKNFIPFQAFNVNSMILQEIEADMFQKRIYQLKSETPISDWNEFLKSNLRRIEYFKFGRPLIYEIFKDLEEENVSLHSYNLEAPYLECCEFKYFAKKLSAGNGILNDEITDIHCLYSIFNLAFGTNYLPSFLNRADLVENYMMTLVMYIDERDPKILEQIEIMEKEKKYKDSSYLIGGFLPEGVINFLSARYFVKFPHSLSKILQTSLGNSICNDKGYGEFLAQFFALSVIFFLINFDLDKVRKLTFQPIYFEDFLRKLGEGSIGGGFLGANPELKNARMSFGYFEHFPKNHIEKPFDLMARCLFRGSALTLNRSCSDLNLMIPLVLGDGRISFVGIKAIYEREYYIEEIVQWTVEKMNFCNIFGYHTDRPFVMLILTLSDSNPQIHIEKSSTNSQNSLDFPNIIIFKGISQSIRESAGLYEIAPMEIMYGGIEETDLEECDRMQGLFREVQPQPNSEEE
jgi:hypothetical protein